MFGPGAKITRINLGPLLGDIKFTPEAALRGLKQEIAKSIRLKIRQESGFSAASKRRTSKGFEVVIGPSSITIVATDPAFRPLVEGQRKQQMTWLTKARAPIPIVLDSGEVIFRSATARSMQNGSWYHPGRERTGIIEAAKEEAKAVIRKRVEKLFKQQLQAALRGR